jgi:hypothetical protein
MVQSAALAQAPVPTEGATLEQRLAVINAGRIVRMDDITIARFRLLIGALREASGEREERIGDMLVKAHQLLAKKLGKNPKLLDFTEQVYRARSAIQRGHFASFCPWVLVLVGTE